MDVCLFSLVAVIKPGARSLWPWREIFLGGIYMTSITERPALTDRQDWGYFCCVFVVNGTGLWTTLLKSMRLNSSQLILMDGVCRAINRKHTHTLRDAHLSLTGGLALLTLRPLACCIVGGDLSCTSAVQLWECFHEGHESIYLCRIKRLNNGPHATLYTSSACLLFTHESSRLVNTAVKLTIHRKQAE